MITNDNHKITGFQWGCNIAIFKCDCGSDKSNRLWNNSPAPIFVIFKLLPTRYIVDTIRDFDLYSIQNSIIIITWPSLLIVLVIVIKHITVSQITELVKIKLYIFKMQCCIPIIYILVRHFPKLEQWRVILNSSNSK